MGIHALVRESLDENEMRPESENFSRPRLLYYGEATMSFLDITEAYNTQSEGRKGNVKWSVICSLPSTALLHGPTVVTSLLNGGVSGTKNYLCCKQCAVVPIGEYNAEHLLSPQASQAPSFSSFSYSQFFQWGGVSEASSALGE